MDRSSIKRIISGTANWLAALPLKCLPAGSRAQVLERLNDEMVTTTQVRGGAIHFFSPSRLLQQRASSVLVKEPDMICWLEGLGPDSVLWDIGANVGVFSLYAAIRTNCTVLAFEPSAANFHVLTRNIQLNRLNERVTAYCLALSGGTELGVLNLASATMGSAMSQFGRLGEMSRYWSGDSKGAVHGMVGFTVDEFIERFNPPFPTHIKLDVDGLEAPILYGATTTLRDKRLLAAMVELSLTDHDEREQAIAFMSHEGFALVSTGQAQEGLQASAANHLFKRVNVLAGAAPL